MQKYHTSLWQLSGQGLLVTFLSCALQGMSWPAKVLTMGAAAWEGTSGTQMMASRSVQVIKPIRVEQARWAWMRLLIHGLYQHRKAAWPDARQSRVILVAGNQVISDQSWYSSRRGHIYEQSFKQVKSQSHSVCIIPRRVFWGPGLFWIFYSTILSPPQIDPTSLEGISSVLSGSILFRVHMKDWKSLDYLGKIQGFWMGNLFLSSKETLSLNEKAPPVYTWRDTQVYMCAFVMGEGCSYSSKVPHTLQGRRSPWPFQNQNPYTQQSMRPCSRSKQEGILTWFLSPLLAFHCPLFESICFSLCLFISFLLFCLSWSVNMRAPGSRKI